MLTAEQPLPEPVELPAPPPIPGAPNGPAAAALVAAGAGCAAFGLAVVAASASEQVNQALDLWSPAGPLTGKSVLATIAWLVTWVALLRWSRGRNVDLARWARVATLLVAVGFIATFPPVFALVHPGS